MKPMWNNRNLRLLVLGQASSPGGELHLEVCPVHVHPGGDGLCGPLCHLPVGGHGAHDCPVALWGILADRGDRRRIMVTLDACAGLAVPLAALTLPLGHALGVIGALLVVLSVLGAFESPTVQACVPQMLEGEDLVRGNAVVAQVQAVASLATPFLGGVLYAAVGLVPVLWGAAGLLFGHRPAGVLPPTAPAGPGGGAGGSGSAEAGPGGQRAVPLAGGAGDVKAAPPGCPGELLPGRGSWWWGFPSWCALCWASPPPTTAGRRVPWGVAAVLGSLWVGLLAGKLQPVHLGRAIGAVGLCLLPVGLAFLCPGDLGAVWGAGGGVLPVPVWVRLLLHLCYRRHPGADPGGSHGEGDVLCVHPLPLRPAPGAAGVWGPV